MDDREARVREAAYRIWQEEGGPHGRDREHWDQAERHVADVDAAAVPASASEAGATPEQEPVAPPVTSPAAKLKKTVSSTAKKAKPAPAAAAKAVPPATKPASPATKKTVATRPRKKADPAT